MEKIVQKQAISGKLNLLAPFLKQNWYFNIFMEKLSDVLAFLMENRRL